MSIPTLSTFKMYVLYFRMNSICSLIFLTVILYETRYTESTKALEFLTTLISKGLEFTNQQLTLNTEQAKEENQSVHQINVYENGSNLKASTDIISKEISEVNSYVNTEVCCEEYSNTELRSNENVSEKSRVVENQSDIAVQNILKNKIHLLKSKIQSLNENINVLPEPVFQDSSFLLEEDQTVNSIIIEQDTTSKPLHHQHHLQHSIVNSITSLEPHTIVHPITTIESQITMSPVTILELNTTVKPVFTDKLFTKIESISKVQHITEEPITTIKVDSTVEPVVTTFEPITSVQPINSGTVTPTFCSPIFNIKCPPVINTQYQYQIPSPQQNVYYHPIPYQVWINNYHSPLNQPIGFQPINQYLPYPITFSNIYTSIPFTHNEVPYAKTNYQNLGVYYLPTSQQIDSTIRSEQVGQWINYGYANLNPIYQPYTKSPYNVPEIAKSEKISNIVFPTSSLTKNMESNLATRVGVD